MTHNHYTKLSIMFLLHFVAMYVLMYAMVNNWSENVYNSFNQFYMAGLMTASMGIVEIAVMGAMYPNKRRNVFIFSASVIALGIFWVFTRQQIAIGDEQFIRSMIPHHSGAILMCERSPLEDAELQELCQSIIDNQQSEINQMKNIYDRLNQ